VRMGVACPAEGLLLSLTNQGGGGGGAERGYALMGTNVHRCRLDAAAARGAHPLPTLAAAFASC